MTAVEKLIVVVDAAAVDGCGYGGGGDAGDVDCDGYDDGGGCDDDDDVYPERAYFLDYKISC